EPLEERVRHPATGKQVAEQRDQVEQSGLAGTISPGKHLVGTQVDPEPGKAAVVVRLDAADHRKIPASGCLARNRWHASASRRSAPSSTGRSRVASPDSASGPSVSTPDSACSPPPASLAAPSIGCLPSPVANVAGRSYGLATPKCRQPCGQR